MPDKTPSELFGSPRQPGNWIHPTAEQLAEVVSRGERPLVAHHDGWHAMRVVELRLSDSRTPSVRFLQVETPHGGLMELEGSHLKTSVLILDPKRPGMPR